MINFKCDICNKNTTNLRSIVLYKKTIDYCPECEKEVEKIIEDFKQEMKQEYILYEERLKKRERDFYNERIKKKI